MLFLSSNIISICLAGGNFKLIVFYTRFFISDQPQQFNINLRGIHNIGVLLSESQIKHLQRVLRSKNKLVFSFCMILEIIYSYTFCRKSTIFFYFFAVLSRNDFLFAI